jgi:hypothetical protein
MALATDYLLALAAVIFAVRTWSVNRAWAQAFLFTALAAFLGGTYHAFAPENALLWKAVVYAVGIASFFLLAGTGGRVLRTFATAKLIVYLIWMATHHEFVWVIADYGLTLLIVGAVHVMRRTRATQWVLSSIAVSILGALVQMYRVTIHPSWFDYNDLYHLIQIAALWMLHRAAPLTSVDGVKPPDGS